MNEVAKAIYAVGNATGRIAKETLLRQYADLHGFKQILRFIFNPYERTGIGAAKLNKLKDEVAYTIGASEEDIADYSSWARSLDYFSQHQTGRTEDVTFGWYFIYSQSTEPAIALAEAIVTKTLKIGITENTLNKVYGADFIPKIGVMLAEKYFEFQNKVPGPYIATRKWDGTRRILVKENGRVTMYSRSGIPDEGLVEIVEEAKYLPDDCVYDGELQAIGEFKDDIEVRQATNSIAATGGEKTGVTFHVFDMITLAEFQKGISDYGAQHRKIMLGATFDDGSIIHLVDDQETADKLRQSFAIKHNFKHIFVTPIIGIARGVEDVMELAGNLWGDGKEGIMLNTFGGKYEIKRSREILKVKRTIKHTLKVIGIEEGKGRLEGTVGNLVIDYKGQRVGCGSGLDDALRAKFWAAPPIGEWVQVESFGESTDNKTGLVSLNCPIFKRMAATPE